MSFLKGGEKVDEYAEMHRLATEAARRGDLEETCRLQKEYFQWAGVIRDIWLFERGKKENGRKSSDDDVAR